MTPTLCRGWRLSTRMQSGFHRRLSTHRLAWSLRAPALCLRVKRDHARGSDRPAPLPQSARRPRTSMRTRARRRGNVCRRGRAPHPAGQPLDYQDRPRPGLRAEAIGCRRHLARLPGISAQARYRGVRPPHREASRDAAQAQYCARQGTSGVRFGPCAGGPASSLRRGPASP